MQHATELIPSLWLSNSAMSADFYTNKEISIAINCGKQEFVNVQIVKKRVQNIDKFHLKHIVKYIHEQLGHGKSILVYSDDMHKSMVIVCAYLANYGGMPYDEVQALVMTKICQ